MLVFDSTCTLSFLNKILIIFIMLNRTYFNLFPAACLTVFGLTFPFSENAS